MATGQRGSTPVSPRNRTGVIFQQQQKERAAKEAAQDSQAELDAAYRLGSDDGFEHGQDAFKTAIVNLYRSEGIEAIQEWLDEETAVTDGDSSNASA